MLLSLQPFAAISKLTVITIPHDGNQNYKVKTIVRYNFVHRKGLNLLPNRLASKEQSSCVSELGKVGLLSLLGQHSVSAIAKE